MSVPRIDFPDLAGLQREHAALIEQIKGERGSLLKLYHLLLTSPEFARGWLGLGTAARNKSSLDEKLRELVILQIGRHFGAAYVWSTHVAIARRAGATDEQLAALPAPPSSPHFTERERTALEYAQVMTDQVRVPDELFERVRALFSPQELLELTVTAGFYNCVCRVVIALRLHEEPGFEPAPFEPAG
ncbi:MAG TPA: carboxymuconolactone decarboxylase family protein [Dehalococcoidia bacterium]|nr:carboxymuconolactone decarboxylase family protein [Dehalococcoidia bacterium]